MSRIYVCGHVNPGTDAIASAMGYAWFLASTSDDEVVPVRAGSINAQTAWALRRLGLEAPELLADASPHFEAVSRRLDTVTPDRPLREAWVIANRTGGVAPVVDGAGKPYGLITGPSLFAFMGRLIGTSPDRQQMRLAEFFELPSKEAADLDAPRDGSVPRHLGSKMLIYPDRRTEGTVGGGKVEVFVEPLPSRPTLVIAGGDHVWRAVPHLAPWSGFRLVVTDDRREFAAPEAIPHADVYIAPGHPGQARWNG